MFKFSQESIETPEMFQWTSEIDLKDFMQETHSRKDFSKKKSKINFHTGYGSNLILISFKDNLNKLLDLLLQI